MPAPEPLGGAALLLLHQPYGNHTRETQRKEQSNTYVKLKKTNSHGKKHVLQQKISNRVACTTMLR